MKISLLKTFKPFYSRNFPEIFNEINDPWGYKTSAFEKERFAKIVGFAESVPNKSILEIGCAEGYLTERLAKISEDITAIDVSTTAIGRAKKKAPKVKFTHSSFENFRPDKHFDLVICSEVFYYFKNKESALEKIKKSGSYLIISNARVYEQTLKKHFKNLKLIKRIIHFKILELKITTISLYRL